jgi:hypothetical protein
MGKDKTSEKMADLNHFHCRGWRIINHNRHHVDQKALWVVLLLIGFVAAGSVYEFYESWLDTLNKKSNKK